MLFHLHLTFFSPVTGVFIPMSLGIMAVDALSMCVGVSAGVS